MSKRGRSQQEARQLSAASGTQAVVGPAHRPKEQLQDVGSPLGPPGSLLLRLSRPSLLVPDLSPMAASCPLQPRGVGRATGSLRLEGFSFVRVHVIFVSATAGRHQPRAPAPL